MRSTFDGAHITVYYFDAYVLVFTLGGICAVTGFALQLARRYPLAKFCGAALAVAGQSAIVGAAVHEGWAWWRVAGAVSLLAAALLALARTWREVR